MANARAGPVVGAGGAGRLRRMAVSDVPIRTLDGVNGPGRCPIHQQLAPAAGALESQLPS